MVLKQATVIWTPRVLVELVLVSITRVIIVDSGTFKHNLPNTTYDVIQNKLRN